uniref:(California timema) hypothetical protein n=1 Tax=Timema californicum TaxID=61474 RepID=A0A7R9JCR5_TIMCA|nr:unnamed protein product [Timema californicum]
MRLVLSSTAEDGKIKVRISNNFFKKSSDSIGDDDDYPGQQGDDEVCEVQSEPPHEEVLPNLSTVQRRRLMRSTELPVYPPDSERCKIPRETPEEYGLLEPEIRNLRLALSDIFKRSERLRTKSSEYKDSTMVRLNDTTEYIRREDNGNLRLGLIGASTLLTSLLGYRGGKCSKVGWATLGALSATSYCHPEQAKEQLHSTLRSAKNCVLVTRNYLFTSHDWYHSEISTLNHVATEEGTSVVIWREKKIGIWRKSEAGTPSRIELTYPIAHTYYHQPPSGGFSNRDAIFATN